jgi:hypothetical protein
MSKVGRFEAAMLLLSLLSFGANFMLTIEAVHYRSFFMAFLALWFFNLGTTLYFAYRLPKLGEDFVDTDEKRRTEARNERAFLLAIFAISFAFSVLLLTTFSGLRLSIAFLLALSSIVLLTAVMFDHLMHLGHYR